MLLAKWLGILGLPHHPAKVPLTAFLASYSIKRTSTRANCSRHAQISRAQRGYSPSHYRASMMPVKCSSMYSDRESGRYLRHDYLLPSLDCMRWDSGPTHNSLCVWPTEHTVQKP